MLFWMLYPNWGSTLYGEVRGSGDFRKVLRGMLGGHLGHRRRWRSSSCSWPRKTFGWDFFTATNANFINYVLRLHDDRPDGPDLELSAAPRCRT